MKRLIEKIIETTNKTGGASFNLNVESPKKGFMVATSGNELVIPEKDFTRKTLRNYVKSNLKNINAKNVNVGTWKENGLVYLDISINIQDKKEAIKLGKENNQIAIFDLSNFESVYLK